MDIKTLYNDLLEAYSNKNLNLITGKLILLYKNKNYGKIREIANKISRYVTIDEEKDAKCFSKLIMLYHPDKGEQSRQVIQKLYEQNDYENLKNHSHILLINDIENVAVSALDEDIDYNPEYIWDVDVDEGFGYADSETENYFANGYNNTEYERSFYNMIKIREYGNIGMEFPTYYLEDFEEFEMAYCGLQSLDGVEFCTHAKILDVSNNLISDLENLWDLEFIEELYLANNQIGYIDVLSNLSRLRILDISGNQIDDISPLLELQYLEYVNLTGNPIPESQINLLKSREIMVMSEKIYAYKNRYR